MNVVDVPRLCSFYFPALITRGSLTISISTGGCSPAIAGYLRQEIEDVVPDNTEAIVDWFCLHREAFKEKHILNSAIVAAFSKKRPLTEAEIHSLIAGEAMDVDT